MKKRPFSVTVIACLYTAAGAMGLAYHLTELNPHNLFQDDILWVSLVRVIAVVCGVYLLLGRNWSRWLALVWIAYHVVLSAFHAWPEFAMHSLLCAVFAFFLFRPPANEYFRHAKIQATSGAE